MTKAEQILARKGIKIMHKLLSENYSCDHRLNITFAGGKVLPQQPRHGHQRQYRHQISSSMLVYQ